MFTAKTGETEGVLCESTGEGPVMEGTVRKES